MVHSLEYTVVKFGIQVIRKFRTLRVIEDRWSRPCIL